MDKSKELGERIFKGVQLAIKKLILERQKEDDYLIILKEGKIVRIKARDLKEGIDY